MSAFEAILMKTIPYYLASRPVQANADLPVTDKFTGEIVARVALADRAVLDRAIAAAVQAAPAMRAMPTFERIAVLAQCVTRFEARREELAQMLCAEAGKPIRDSRGEVQRLIDTFQIAAAECQREHGEILPLDLSPRGKGYRGMWRRVPIGPCALISPFNFPLNLAAHKIAPAIAVGNTFVLKPASLTPLGALAIGEVLAETSLPPGAFSILPCRREEADLLITDERLKLLSFTGSAESGWDLKARAGKKKVSLELGGNAACIVEADADLADAASRLVFGAFYQSGQSCISVQRILVQRPIYAELRDRLVTATRQLKSGDPRDEQVSIGPVITDKDAERLEAWISEAVARGGRVLCGGKRSGRIVEPTLLENVPHDASLCAQEAFGPVAVLEPYDDFAAALARANDSRYGLQAGVFTRDLTKMFRAWDELEVGGVVINDVPSWRADQMPYGGVKESGLGREGIRFAMEEMSELRMLVVRTRT